MPFNEGVARSSEENEIGLRAAQFGSCRGWNVRVVCLTAGCSFYFNQVA